MSEDFREGSGRATVTLLRMSQLEEKMSRDELKFPIQVEEQNSSICSSPLPHRTFLGKENIFGFVSRKWFFEIKAILFPFFPFVLSLSLFLPSIFYCPSLFKDIRKCFYSSPSTSSCSSNRKCLRDSDLYFESTSVNPPTFLFFTSFLFLNFHFLLVSSYFQGDDLTLCLSLSLCLPADLKTHLTTWRIFFSYFNFSATWVIVFIALV